MQYRLTLTIRGASHLDRVLAALAPTDPEITLSLMPKPEEVIHGLHAPSIAPMRGASASEAAMDSAPGKSKRARRGNGPWPAEGSIYSVVLAALKDEPKKPQELREALQAGGFAVGSLNSALVRLEKASKIKKGDDGAWAAA